MNEEEKIDTLVTQGHNLGHLLPTRPEYPPDSIERPIYQSKQHALTKDHGAPIVHTCLGKESGNP